MELHNDTSHQAQVSPSPDSESWTSLYVVLLFLYPLVCALLRNDRLRTIYETFPYTTRASFASMTDNDAQQIQMINAELEFPFTFEKALQFALFRSYGIPTISKLLVATSQFSEPSTACKRYVDTSILISEFMGYKPTEERTREAIGRMNFIHSGYRKSGKLLDDDMLYTLSLFVTEPIRWINKYEWRQLDDIEVCAIGTFWKSVGDAMDISWEKLKSGTGGREGTWKDGVQWVEELMEWSEQYEAKFMVPNINSMKTADETTRILLWAIPGPLKGVGKHFVSALMDDRLRKAMMYPKPPQLYFTIVSVIFGIRKYILRYLTPPRPYFLRVHHITDNPTQNGTYHNLKYDAAPYYVKPTTWERWQPMAWYTWIMGLPLPGDEGAKYHPEGYKIPEVGPDKMSGRGEDFMKSAVEVMRGTRKGGCVFMTKEE